MIEIRSENLEYWKKLEVLKINSTEDRNLSDTLYIIISLHIEKAGLRTDGIVRISWTRRMGSGEFRTTRPILV